MNSLIQPGTAPLEGKYKPLLPGVVRNSLSILSLKWQLDKDSSSTAKPLSHSPCPVGSSTLTRIHIPLSDGPTSSISAPPASSSLVQSFYQEPRLLTEEDVTAAPRAFERDPDATITLPYPNDPGYTGYNESLGQTSEYCSCSTNLDDILTNREEYGAASSSFNDSGYISLGFENSALSDPDADFQGRPTFAFATRRSP